MELVMVAVGACGLACWFIVALLLARRSRQSWSIPVSAPRNPTREEDRVRPVVAPSGERIWIAPDELVWHEIVAWPRRRTTTPHLDDVHRSA
jgi:hypothetical protein